MSTPNKRISQLVELTAQEVSLDDLFLIVDRTANESKKIQASELSLWLNVSGSLYAVHAINADTASYVLGSNIHGLVLSASNAQSSSTSLFANSSTTSTTAVSASNALTASFALNAGGGNSSASFLIYSGTPNGTSSYAVNSATSITSENTTFLIYSGGNNGTASYAITTQNVLHSTQADTASYFNNGPDSMIASASYAVNADSTSFTNTANTAAFLQFSPNNGTSSYAISAGSVVGSMKNYGMVTAYSQSLSTSTVDNLIVSSSLGTGQQTLIESIGSLILYFTSSNITNYSISLMTLNRYTGEISVLDNSDVGLNTTPIISTWGNPESGSLTLPFNLLGQQSLYGNYLVEVTSSSPNVVINPRRTTKFKFSSDSDILNIQPDENVEFLVSPNDVTMSFSSSLGGPFTDSLAGLLQTGSQNITWIDINSQSVDDIRYTWRCKALTTLNCHDNQSLQTLKYAFPNSLQRLQCYSCSLFYITDLSNTKISYFDCSNNLLTSIPQLSVSTSYVDFSNNPVTLMPSFLPDGLTAIYAQNSLISSVPYLPDNVVTASFSNTMVSSLPNPLPLSMSYLDVSFTSMFTMSMAPEFMTYLNLASASFDITALENVTSQLVNNGMVSGNLNIQGYGTLSGFSPLLLSNIAILQGNGWNVSYDS